MDDYSDMPPLISLDEAYDNLLSPLSSATRETPFSVLMADMKRILHMGNPILLEELVVLMFKTRDPRGGRGERKLFQWMFAVLNEYYPSLCVQLLPYIPHYGCWKDIFQIAMHHQNLFNAVIQMSHQQLLADEAAHAAGQPISLFAKWVPKEGKSMARFAKYFANYLYGNNPTMDHSARMAQLRYRISALNKYMRTAEVLQCANRWDEILPTATPSIARNKIHVSLMKVMPDDPKRKICRERFDIFFKCHTPKAHTDTNDRYTPIRQLYWGVNQVRA